MSTGSADSQQGRLRVRRGVIGILSRGDAYLVIRRSPKVAMGGHWCFPGGHVERGETPRQAVGRELAEELGVKVIPTQRVGSVRVGTKYILAVWRVDLVHGDLRIARSEIAEARWLTPSEIRAIRPNLPSNEDVLQMLGV